MTLAEVKTFILDAGVESLNEIRETLNYRLKKTRKAAAKSFRYGDRVRFRSKGSVYEGNVTKVNRVNVLVTAGTKDGKEITSVRGRHWKVAATLLEHVE